MSTRLHLFGNVRLRIVAVTALLLAGASIVSFFLLRTALTQRLDEEITTALIREVEEFQILNEGVNPTTGQPFGDDLEAVYDLYFAREVPDEGETLIAFVDGELYEFERDRDGLPVEEIAGPIEAWIDSGSAQAGRADSPSGEIYFRVVSIEAGDRTGTFAAVNLPREELREIDQAVATLGFIEGITILVATVIGYLLSGQVLRPLRSLADTARRISETDLTQRMPTHGDAESVRISQAFNDMLARLEVAFDTQRRFLDEASHELRAPLTVIRGHVELLDLEDDPEEREATTTLITSEIDRMNRMVEDLLTLARAERPDFLDLEPLDLQNWTADCFSKARMLGDRDWRLDGSASGMINVDGQRLTQAVMQLAANAVQHSSDGDLIRLGTRLADGTLTAWVDDQGAGVAPDDADRIFERFHRGRHDGRSSGLGLSIVQAICEAHGGRALLVPRAGAGSRFEIRIPATVVARAPAPSPVSPA